MTGVTNPLKNTRKLGSITFSSGGQQSLQLDKNGVLLRLLLRLQFTVTNSATAPVGPLFMTLARLLRNVQVLVGGRDVVQNMTGWAMAARAIIEAKGVYPQGMAATVNTTASAVTSYDVTLPVDFTLPLGARFDDTALDTTGLSQLSLIVSWGTSDAADLFATPNGAAISNVSLDIEGEYIPNPFRDPKTGMAISNGIAVQQNPATKPKPYMVRQLDYQQVDISATNSNLGITIDQRTGLVLTSIMAIALADNVGTDSIVNSLSMDAASLNFLNRDAPEIRASNLRDLELTTGTIPGMLYVDPRVRGSLTNSIATAGLAGDLKWTADVTEVGTVCQLFIQREGVRPLLTTV